LVHSSRMLIHARWLFGKSDMSDSVRKFAIPGNIRQIATNRGLSLYDKRAYKLRSHPMYIADIAGGYTDECSRSISGLHGIFPSADTHRRGLNPMKVPVFWRLYDKAHAVYLKSFPPDVREPRQTITKYMRWASDPEERYPFHYLTAFCLHVGSVGFRRGTKTRLEYADVVGMQSFDVLAMDKGPNVGKSMQFVGYTATDGRLRYGGFDKSTYEPVSISIRGKGVATELTAAGLQIAVESTPEGYSLAYSFSESDPSQPQEQARFLQNVGGYGVMSVETPKGIVPVSYEQPRRVKNQGPVPLNANLALVQNGQIIKSDGNPQAIGKDEAHAVLRRVLDFYTEDEPDFVIRDAERILRTVETQPGESRGGFAYLVPQSESIRK